MFGKLDKENNADIICNISAKSIKESNLVLRQFYDEVSKSIKVAWNYQTHREKNIVFVGMSSFGDMWFDYDVKGLIKNIYVSTPKKEIHDIVKRALNKVAQKHYVLNEYNVEVWFYSDDISFRKMCRKNIEIISELNEDNKYITKIKFSVKAFGTFDLKYIMVQKINYLKHLLCVYTNFQFEFLNNYTIIGEKKYIENSWNNYDLKWIDYFFDESKGAQNAELIPDFFDLFRVILDYDSYEKTMRLLLNSAQEMYCGKLMLDISIQNAKYGIPGYTDLTNTILVSALEPLANIGVKKAEHCPICGNLKYKIRGKVKDLCSQYFNEYLVKEIADIEYGKRSAFLHEGNATTNEFYSGQCIPLINPNTGNTMLGAFACVNLNLFDYVTYVFRQKVHELLADEKVLFS